MIGKKISYLPKPASDGLFSSSGLGMTVENLQNKKPTGYQPTAVSFPYNYKAQNPSPSPHPQQNARFGPYKTGVSPPVVTLTRPGDSLRNSKRTTARVEQRINLPNPQWTLVDSKEDILKSIFSTNTSTQYGGKADPSGGIIVQNLSKKIADEYGVCGTISTGSPATGSHSTAASTNNSYVIKNVSMNYTRTPLKRIPKNGSRPLNFNVSIPANLENRLKASSGELTPAKPNVTKQSTSALQSVNPTVGFG